MTDTVLVLAWLVFAHLVADFVLQNDWIAINKATGGREGWRRSVRTDSTSRCASFPSVLAYGPRGIVYLVVVIVTHMLVDRWKVQATRRAEAERRGAARARIERTGGAPASGLGGAGPRGPGSCSSPTRRCHLTIAIVGWLVILAGVALLPPFRRRQPLLRVGPDRGPRRRPDRRRDRVAVHRQHPRRPTTSCWRWSRRARCPGPTSAAPEPTPAPAPSGYTVRVGP